MLFCPFCGKPIVIPEQDDAPNDAPESAPAVALNDAPETAPAVAPNDAPETAPAAVTDDAPDAVPAVARVSDFPSATGDPGKEDAPAGGEPHSLAADKPQSDLTDRTASDAAEAAGTTASDAPEPTDDAAAELLDWSRERRSHMDSDVWARPEAPAADFSPLELDEGAEKPEGADWREEIVRKKQASTPEKKPPKMAHDGEPPVRLEGSAPKLKPDAADGKSRGKNRKGHKPANTLVPPKTMNPNDIFMDGKRAAYDEVDPYDYDDDGLAGSFSFEDEEENSFFMRHLRGIVSLALFVILLLLIVIYACSRAGQLSLARANIAWSKDAYSTLGYQSFQEGKYGEAGLYYERALQRDPDSYSFASSAAMAYLEAGENEKAAAMLKRCAQIDPTKLEPYIYLLKLYPDASARPWDITQLLQQGYQRTGDARLNVTG